jgi:hypothetical protein
LNLYVLGEGRRTERLVYRSWLGHVLPDLREVHRIEDVVDDHFILRSGGGYPSYMQEIEFAARDITAHGAIEFFLLCIDAEESSAEEKIAEVEAAMPSSCPARLLVVVHDCCMETWFLGNRKIVRRQPERPELRHFLDFYNVVKKDPEGMPAMAGYLTRAQFHFDYLREIFRERGLSYSKRMPGDVQSLSYLEELVRRREQTGHLESFAFLLEAWREMGASLPAST